MTAATGIITTIVNNSGVAGYSGDGGAATAAQIDWPTGLCVKGTGEVIISDTNNSCLRQVSITNTISTLPMTVGPGLNSPDGAVSTTTMPPRRGSFSISPIREITAYGGWIR